MKLQGKRGGGVRARACACVRASVREREKERGGGGGGERDKLTEVAIEGRQTDTDWQADRSKERQTKTGD